MSEPKFPFMMVDILKPNTESLDEHLQFMQSALPKNDKYQNLLKCMQKPPAAIARVYVSQDDIMSDIFDGVAFNGIKEMLDHISMNKNYFLINKEKWNFNNLKSIMDIYGNEVVAVMIEAAADCDW